jgi:hypothetical protein
MKRMMRYSVSLVLFIGAVAFFSYRPQNALAYVEAPMSFGAIVAQSSNIVLMRVEAVDREKNLIIYRKIADIKGKHPTDVIKHNIGRGGLRPNEWKPQMDWAEPGKIACFFYNGGASETCIGNWWYQAYAGGEWWNHSHAEPFLLRSYCGPPERLTTIVADMMAGKEVVVSCMMDGNKEDLHNRKAKMQRLKVSLKLQDYNQKRDFVGYGGEDFRRIGGMPGFTHITNLGRLDPEAQAISTVDMDGDGKLDLCLVGANRVMLLQNGGEALSEFSLPGRFGARSAVWADYNRDGKPDLLLATPQGPKLFSNLGGGQFKDDSNLLPLETFYNLTAAAWIDYDGDGLTDVLLANGFHGLRLYRNTGVVATPKLQPGAKPDPNPPTGTGFTDVSDQVGLGQYGIAAGLKGDTLTVADVNGDGRPDFLFGAGQGVLALAKDDGGKVAFVASPENGIHYTPGKVGPVFADIDNDGFLDLFVPQKDGSKLFKNDGKGKFTAVTDKAGDLATFKDWATSAAWGDFDNDGKPDLLVGCLRGPNRLFRNKGAGVFEDVTDKVGLDQHLFNSQAVALTDLNGDGYLDAIFNNEGQESVILLGSNTLASKRIPVTYNVLGKSGVVGSKVQVADKEGKLIASQEISGGDGRGGQQSPLVRFALEPGSYKVSIRFSNGRTQTSDLQVNNAPIRGKIEEEAKQ